MNPSLSSIPLHARSLSLQHNNTTEMFRRPLSPPPAINTFTRERSGSGRSGEPLDSQISSPNDAAGPTKKSETILQRSPSRKLSGNGFFRMARQASDTAFRNLHRKGSNNNMGASRREPSVYQQNPRFYLYQQQQYQDDQDTPFGSSFVQTHSDDNLVGGWTMVQSEPRQPMEHFKPGGLRKNMSLPDINAEYARETSDHPVARATSPVNHLPGQATNSGRSQSRPRMQPHQFVTTGLSNNSVTASSEQQRETSDKEQELHVGCTDQSVSHNQHCEHLTRHQVLSEDSLSSLETRSLVGNKDLPPIPHGQTPAFQLCTRIRRKDDTESPISPVGVVSPILPNIASDSLKRKESKGFIPQDVLKNMDRKDIQKAIKDTVITSRVYKVMGSEQIDALRKEQDELEQFIEAMNVSLHIESRIRDASHSLIRLHENNANIDAVKAATSQLHATTRKMDQIVQKTQEAMWRLMTIQRLLLQHEGAVLNAGLRRLDTENRELSRTVMHLDTARDQEKEEKIKWKKEHNRLKFNSILFPSTPVMDEFENKSSTSATADQTLQKQAQLESMQRYVKELNDDILHKDEKLVEARDELQAVKGWVADFQASIQSRKPTPTEDSQPNSNAGLQVQLRDLQSTVEVELKDMDVQVQELKSKIETLLRENNTLAGRTKIDDETRSEQRQLRRNRPSLRAKKHARQGSDLQNVLRDSLLELDRQIRQDIEQSASSSSRPSSTSTSTTAFSVDSLNSPLSRNTSHRSGSPLSRSHSSVSSDIGPSEPVQKENIQFEVSFQESFLTSSDDDPIEDASEEIQRLNTMVHEMQQIVKRHSAAIEAQ